MRKLWRNDVFWNAAGSLLYALASMVLSFFVLRLMGPRDGGIFGFGFSTFGQQIFIIAYFGIRPFQITDMAGEYRFSEYHFARRLSSLFALLSSLLFLWLMVSIGSYDGIKAELLFLLSFYKLLDGFSDVYESELQRRGRLYLAGQSLFFRTGLSMLSLILSLLVTRNMLFSCILMDLTQLLGLYLFALLPLRSLGELPGSEAFSGEKRRGRSLRLLRSTSFLFLSAFLDFYIFSASKYALDLRLGSESSGIFNVLFMPTSFIYLVANFLIRPMLTRLATERREERYEDFSRSCRFLILAVFLMALGISLTSLFLGEFGLRIFELLLGMRYRGALLREILAFLILIAGGGFYALANVQYYILVTMRRQGTIFFSYVLVSLLALVSADRAVQCAGILGGAICYLFLMAILFLFFSLSVLRGLWRMQDGGKNGTREGQAE